MEIIGLLLLFLFMAWLFFLINSDVADKKYKKEQLEKKWREERQENERKYEEIKEKEKLKKEQRQKEKEQRQKEREINDEIKAKQLSFVKDTILTKFSTLIAKLRERYPNVNFDLMLNEEVISKILNKNSIQLSNNENIDNLVSQLAIYSYQANNQTWNSINPLIAIDSIKLNKINFLELPYNWSQIRDECFQRDGKKCQRCGLDLSDRQFHCHHLISRSQGGGHKLTNLATLCVDCHSMQGGLHETILRDKNDITQYLEKMLRENDF